MNSKNRFITALFEEYAQIMVQTAYRYTGSFEIAEELMQEAFLTLSLKYERVKDHENPPGWLFTTLNYLMRRETSKKAYTSEIPAKDEFLENKAGLSAAFPNSIMEILPNNLPSQDVSLLKYVYEEDLSYEEISGNLGITPNACRNRLHRLHNRLKKLI